MNPTVFVSHSNADSSWCDAFVATLQSHGLDVWYDKQGLKLGSKWIKEIEREILAREVFIIVLSPNSWVSEWVQDEFYLAYQMRKQIIGVIYQNVELQGFIRNIQLFSAVNKTSQEVAKVILDALYIQNDTPLMVKSSADYDHTSNDFLLGRVVPLLDLARPVLVSRSLGLVRCTSKSDSTTWIGGGVLVSPSLLLTTSHILPDIQSLDVEVSFKSGLLEHEPVDTYTVRLGGLFLSDHNLDISMVELDNGPGNQDKWGYVPILHHRMLEVEETINFISFGPEFKTKQVSIGNDIIRSVSKPHVTYSRPKNSVFGPGSSGFPIFNADWAMVGFHLGRTIAFKQDRLLDVSEGVMLEDWIDSLPQDIRDRLEH